MKMYPKNSGYVLVSVMIISIIAVIMLSSLFKFGEVAHIRYSTNQNERQAFWYAEAGLEEMHSMLANYARPFGWGALPNVGATLTRSFKNGSYSLLIEQLPPTNSVYNLAGVAQNNLYLLTATGICNGHTNSISTQAELQNFTQSVLSTRGTGVSFTSMDRFVGPIYMDGVFKLREYVGWPLPVFQGIVNATAQNVFINFATTPDEYVVYPQGATDPIFPEGIFLNSSALDFTGDNTSDYINDIKNNAGLTLNGNHTIQLLPNGEFYYYNDGNTNTITTNLVANIPDNTLFVNGHLTIGGVLNGVLTIGNNVGVTITDEGLRYASAPTDDINPETWTTSEIQQINDLLGIITKNYIVCEGLDPIEAHGAFMITNGGMYPTERGTICPLVNGRKPSMFVFGSMSAYELAATERGVGGGFGAYWVFDPRLADYALQNFAHRNYAFHDWRWTF